MKVIIAASQTGGHINPGIAIANKIKKENPNADIIFIGTHRGLENDLVPRAGYELKTIEAYGIVRKVTLQNLKKMFKTFKGYEKAKKILKKEKPDIVIGTGGFICGPVLLAASKQNIPTLLHESNAFPGLTVKLLSKKVDEILVGFEDAKKRLPKAKKVVVTGTPTKVKHIELSKEKKEEFLKEKGLDNNLPVVLAFGGSQGAKPINSALEEIIENNLNKNYQLLWAAGPKQYTKIKDDLKSKNIEIDKIKNVKVVPYIYDMEEALAACDLVVCRSGAMTLTEVSIAKKPAIFVPLSFAAENHQEYNAKVLVKKEAAKIIHDDEINGKTLNSMIDELIEDPEELHKMGENAGQIVMHDVENKIYKEIESTINSHKM